MHTLEELSTFSAKVSTAQRRKRHLAEGLPHAPGVYLFRDERARVLYVGTSRDLRTRVRSYFTASETRSRIGEMVGLAESVDRHRVRDPARGRGPRAAADRRAQAALQPPVAVPREGPLPQAHPRAVAAAVAGAAGRSTTTPTTSARSPRKQAAEKCLAALHETFPLRQCTAADRPQPVAAPPCVLAEMGRCLSPCDGSVDATTYAAVVRQLRDNLLRRPDDVVDADHAGGWPSWPSGERFEEAGVHRDRLAAFVRAVAAHPAADRADPHAPRSWRPGARTTAGWAVHVVRHGRLAAAGVIPRRRRRPPVRRRAAWPAARRCAGGPGPVPAATAEETEKILRWLEAPGVRLVEVDGEWTCPVGGATRHLALHDAVDQSAPRPGALRRAARPADRAPPVR